MKIINNKKRCKNQMTGGPNNCFLNLVEFISKIGHLKYLFFITLIFYNVTKTLIRFFKSTPPDRLWKM